jgi:hypothetical protein
LALCRFHNALRRLQAAVRFGCSATLDEGCNGTTVLKCIGALAFSLQDQATIGGMDATQFGALMVA